MNVAVVETRDGDAESLCIVHDSVHSDNITGDLGEVGSPRCDFCTEFVNLALHAVALKLQLSDHKVECCVGLVVLQQF